MTSPRREGLRFGTRGGCAQGLNTMVEVNRKKKRADQRSSQPQVEGADPPTTDE